MPKSQLAASEHIGLAIHMKNSVVVVLYLSHVSNLSCILSPYSIALLVAFHMTGTLPVSLDNHLLPSFPPILERWVIRHTADRQIF